ncbi:MAG: hypothetical protein EP332_00205 [Bacteroidetes bacterium]|nr:MAG: hypothetical protein EP332_00205 [Bacteroidota bacterium]
MKKTILWIGALLLTVSSAVAQNRNIESAKIALRQETYEDAIYYIEEAAKNESTANDRKMWFERGRIYLTVAQLQNEKKLAKVLDAKASKKSLESFINCIVQDKAEGRRRYEEADDMLIQAAVTAYNDAIQDYNAGRTLLENGDEVGAKVKIGEAVTVWELILKAYEHDVNKQISTTYNTPEINVYQLIADASISIGDKAKAYELFGKVMNAEKPASYAFVKTAYMKLEDGDTTAALDVIEKGKVYFPEEKDLTTLQLIIYQNQGKEDLLTDKITEALKDDPENTNLLYNRGNLYDNRARRLVDNMKTKMEANYELNSKIRKERDPKKKAALQSELKASKEEVEKMMAKQQVLDSLAVADYKKAYDISGGTFDIAYNLGAVYFNSAVPLVEKANNLPSDKDYDKNYAKLKTEWLAIYEESLKWFLIAEELQPDNQNVLLGLQQVYAQMGNQEKSEEYRQKRKN